MSLNVALSSAVSSLLVIEKQMGTVSNNISNANTAGYTQETVTTATRSVDGTVTGVTASSATSYVDQYLEQSIVQNTSSSSQSSTYYAYYQTLSDAMGTISTSSSGSTDLSSELTSLQTTLSSLGTSPEDTALKTKAVSELTTVCQDLRSTSTTIQDQRAQADQEIATAVSDANTQLNTIADLNKQIRVASAAGQSTAALNDQRNTALESLSSDLGINYYQDSNGNVQVYSSGGTPLLVGDTVSTLSHTAASSVDSSVSYTEGASTGIDGITCAGQDITDSISGGKIAALVQMRDTDLVNAQSELDNLSSTLATTLNTIHNQGTSATAPQTLTGTSSTPFSSGESLSTTSDLSVRVAIIDSDGKAQSYADVDLSGCSSVSDVVSTINAAISAQSPSGTCTLNSSGQVVLSSSNASYGIGITTLSGSIAADSTTLDDDEGTDVSSYFHLNDLLVNSDSAQTVTVRSDLASSPGYLASGALTSTSSPGTPPFTAVTSGDGTIASSLSSALSSTSQSFDSAGNLSSTSKSFADYAALIVSDVSQRYSNAKTSSTTDSTTLTTLQSTFSSKSGVNTDEQTAHLTELQNMYAASAKIVTIVQSMFQSLISAVSA
ncbi:MAG TPA: flagellar hook-associated protein FlgK [Candidatus Sulfotelmatobacter sp.]|jgi:flagellar hook-associated protein 1 FlgK|nr:flagellar hook-associated protein FlgK [Candidatus Sulfotelmatobacter sp.]